MKNLLKLSVVFLLLTACSVTEPIKPKKSARLPASTLSMMAGNWKVYSSSGESPGQRPSPGPAPCPATNVQLSITLNATVNNNGYNGGIIHIASNTSCFHLTEADNAYFANNRLFEFLSVNQYPGEAIYFVDTPDEDKLIYIIRASANYQHFASSPFTVEFLPDANGGYVMYFVTNNITYLLVKDDCPTC